MNVVAEMLLNDPAPAAIWATLILLTFPALLLLGSPEAMRHPGRMLRDLIAGFRSTPQPSSQDTPSQHGSSQDVSMQYTASQHGSPQDVSAQYVSAQSGSPRHGSPQDVSAHYVSARSGSPRHGSAQDVPAQHGSSQGVSAQYASEVRVAAERAAVAAQRWQELWEQAETAMNAAYESWLDADARLCRATVAARWGIPWSAPTCEEYAARERFLHRAVAAACDRGDLPAEALADALAGRNGWDARLHPVDQELVIARATATYRRRCYDAAVTAEQTARHDAGLARRASSSLSREALAAEATPFAAAASPASPLPRRRTMAIPAT